MSTGSDVANDVWGNDPNGNPYGVRRSKSWVGADRPKVDYAKDPIWIITREGKRIRMRGHSAFSRPPRRVRNEPHYYNMSSYYFSDEPVTFIRLGDTSPITRAIQAWFSVYRSPTNLLDSNDDLKLIGKLAERVRGSDFNAGVFLGEGHQTLNLIADSAIRIAKSLFHLKKGDLAGSLRSLIEGTSRKPIKPYSTFKPFRPTQDAMSRHWLEIQYGWRPLLSDVNAAAQSLAHFLSAPLQTRYSAKVEKEDLQPKVVQLDPLDGRTASSMSILKSKKRMIIVVAEKGSIPAQLGLLNPASVAWELMPWSFVIDWFIPVGQYLDARSFTSCTQASVITTTLNTSFTTPVTGLGTGNNRRNSAVVMARIIGANLPSVPLPSFKPLSKAASWEHCANALALLQGLRGK